MRGSLYKAGDRIVVRTGMVRSAEPRGSGEILAVLPETHGAISYRVRFHSENFERNVSQDDIDIDASARAQDEFKGSAGEKPSAWIKPGAFKIKRR